MITLELSVQGREGISPALMVYYALAGQRIWLLQHSDHYYQVELMEHMNIINDLISNICVQMGHQILENLENTKTN